jgi:DNA polymerase-3 subunit delta
LPAATQADVRKQIADGRVAPLYLLLGTDESAKVKLAGEFLDLIDPDLRAFNTDRLYGGETNVADVVDAARTLPMMVPRRVVLLLHAERLLNPKKDTEASARDLEALEAYLKSPVDTCCLVIVAEALDKRRSLSRLLTSKAVVVDCSGPVDVAAAARWVREHVAQEGMTIEPRAAQLVADRIGPDIARLRSSVEQLVLYAADQKTISEADVKEVVPVSASAEEWGVTNAIERGVAGDALRELALMLENGAVPYMILGQLAWFVRTKVPAPRVPSAVEAVFRTDLAIKTSAGDPRALLERLVVELCTR